MLSIDDISTDLFSHVAADDSGLLRFQLIMGDGARIDTFFILPTRGVDLVLWVQRSTEAMPGEPIKDEPFCHALLRECASKVSDVSETSMKCPIYVENRFGFTHAFLAGPESHSCLKGMVNGRGKIVLCVPIHDCEFSDSEAGDGIANRIVRHKLHCWERHPTPVVMLKFKNAKTAARTRGNLPVETDLEYALHEIRSLVGNTSSFVEVQNFRLQHCRVTSTRNRELKVEATNTVSEMTLDEVQKYVTTFLIEGVGQIKGVKEENGEENGEENVSGTVS